MTNYDLRLWPDKALKKVSSPVTNFSYLEKIIPYVEGCLSFPQLNLLTLRKKHIQIEYVNKFNEVYSRTLSGKNAVVFQHELDHLNGIMMFQQYMSYCSSKKFS